MNQCNTLILPRGDTDGRFSQATKMILVHSSFHAMECTGWPKK